MIILKRYAMNSRLVKSCLDFPRWLIDHKPNASVHAIQQAGEIEQSPMQPRRSTNSNSSHAKFPDFGVVGPDEQEFSPTLMADSIRCSALLEFMWVDIEAPRAQLSEEKPVLGEV